MAIEVDRSEVETVYAFITDGEDFIYACPEDKLGGAILELNWLYEDEYRIINKADATLTIRDIKGEI